MFRFNSFNCRFSRPQLVTALVEQKLDKNGVVFSSFVESPIDSSKLPSFTNYKLQTLLSAGVPLKPVSPVYNEVPDDATLARLDSSLTSKDDNKPLNDN